MTQKDQSSEKSSMILWLFMGCFLILGMVVVGGITRLTGSGLSITEWKVLTGSIPPLNEDQWTDAFDHYKLIPQYKLLNSNFTLNDFKFIYFWEFIHRLIGRMIGVVFLIGFIHFYNKKVITKELMPKLLFMFVLGGIQGFLGWYMVSSGLTENVRVSHIRLAIHLTFAFITFGYIFKVALSELYPVKNVNSYAVTKYKKFGITILILLIIQIIYGAFVAGTKSGWTYNTWPKMEGEWVPESMTYMLGKEGSISLINNLASVQFIHRTLAYLITALVLFVGISVFRDSKLSKYHKDSALVLLSFIFIQVLLGIVTLLYKVPISLGVIHQAMAFFLFAASIYFLHRLKHEPMKNKIA